jgi:mono/diheme cytochrome c family protein
MYKTSLLFTALLLVTACSNNDTDQSISLETIDPFAQDKVTKRWYTEALREEGKVLFQAHCAVCHGKNAEATPNWKTQTPSGHYPPPPLNGSAHAWHHPLSVLEMVIADGGAPMGGVMPSWKYLLSEEQRLATIAAFQDYWTDEIYERWLEIEKSSRE